MYCDTEADHLSTEGILQFNQKSCRKLCYQHTQHYQLDFADLIRALLKH